MFWVKSGFNWESGGHFIESNWAENKLSMNIWLVRWSFYWVKLRRKQVVHEHMVLLIDKLFWSYQGVWKYVITIVRFAFINCFSFLLIFTHLRPILWYRWVTSVSNSRNGPRIFNILWLRIRFEVWVEKATNCFFIHKDLLSPLDMQRITNPGIDTSICNLNYLTFNLYSLTFDV